MRKRGRDDGVQLILDLAGSAETNMEDAERGGEVRWHNETARFIRHPIWSMYLYWH